MKRLTKFFNRHPIAWAFICALVALYCVIRLFFTPPLLRDIGFSTAYYDRNGRLLRLTLAADDKYRLYTPLAEISETLRRATILYEDKYFRFHPGINPVALARAAKNYWRGAAHPAGASTITMQVARMKYDLDTTRPKGKLIQIAAAIYIDAFYSKSEILEAYLNLAPYGGNIEGAGAASLIYFHRAPYEISAIESITLSTIPQNPSKRGLNTAAGLRNMSKMRGALVHRWLAEFPDQTPADTLAQMPLHAYGVHDLPFYAPHFTTHEIMRRRARWRRNETSGGRIKTTLDLGLQNALEQQLGRELARRRAVGIQNAAAVLVNYKTMEVLAHIGSADYFDKSIYGENDGVHARRSPGSTLKPLIYAAAADAGLIHAMTMLKDAKINFGVYAPENSDSEFYGPVLARDALTHSRNIPAINLVRQIGTQNFYRLLVNCGVANLQPPSHYGISVALGGAEVSMMELAGIYATIANTGMRRDIKTTMDDAAGDEIQLLSPEAFFLTLDMLGRQATPTVGTPFAKKRADNLRHYWKTGTSSSYRDAWTAGIFGDFVLIVWVGNFDGRPNNAFSGARAAAPIYFALSQTIRDHFAARGTPVVNNNFLRPDMNISQIEMCEGVGGIAGQHCPKSVKSYFIPGKSPIAQASVYRAVAIDKKTGLRSCTRDSRTTRMQVYEFWDAEYLDMFRRAGITRNTPPPYVPGCKLDDIAAARPAPLITSPADGTRIIIVRDSDMENVSFRAITDDANAKIFWFLDDEVIGTSRSGETFEHTVPMGEHTVRAMDELGAGQSAVFSVVK